MLSFFGKKYIDVIGTIRVKDLIKKEYFHVRNRENELYIFLEKCFVTLGVIKVGKPDFNNYVSRAYKIIKKTYKKNKGPSASLWKGSCFFHNGGKAQVNVPQGADRFARAKQWRCRRDA